MKYFAALVFIITVLVSPVIVSAQSIGIACVDYQRTMIESEEGKQIQKVLSEEQERMKKNAEAKQDELQKLKDALEKQGATITPEARAEKEKQYQTKLKDYQRLIGDYQSELQQKNSEYSQKVLKEIDDIVRAIGEREKYTVILEKNQAGIVFFTPAVDITDKVIAAYNDQLKKKTPAKAPVPAPVPKK